MYAWVYCPGCDEDLDMEYNRWQMGYQCPRCGMILNEHGEPLD